jgi:23S rRNA pseudouridine955/2504/2580 synthase
VVFSASLAGARFFSALLRDGLLVKRYLAVAEGSISKGGVWEDGLLRDRDLRKTLGAEQGKPARTRFEPLSRGKGFTLLELRPETGRTHQIRAQAALHGCPLAGDRKYGSRTDIPGRNRAGGISFLLHAWRLEIPPGRAGETPAGEEGPVLPPLLEAPVPGYFRETLFDLFGKYAQNFR